MSPFIYTGAYTMFDENSVLADSVHKAQLVYVLLENFSNSVMICVYCFKNGFMTTLFDKDSLAVHTYTSCIKEYKQI